MKIRLALLLLPICVIFQLKGQLKFIIEDFEGFSDGESELKTNGVFTYGCIKADVVSGHDKKQNGYAGQRFLTLRKEGKMKYGGWGKGMGLFAELSVNEDYLNFYVNQYNDTGSLRIELQEDDNEDNIFNKDADDSWICIEKPQKSKSWLLVSIPLNKFKDGNKGGDGIFNVNFRQGRLFCLIISFLNAETLTNQQEVSFDFICFSKGKLPAGAQLFDAPARTAADFCSLGAWSKEGNTANFADIASGFENNFSACDKKLGVIHFFQPFSFDGGNTQNMYPSVDRINKVVHEGYVPMITLENHFVNANPGMKQPNLYSIIEGHFDWFFTEWAKQIRQVDSVVLLRILHEFNGNWYPWCIANNDRNPELFIKAFRHIHEIFNAQGVNNVKFIWCPNSMSTPQEKWNFIMDAYPGDEYVDYVGLDIYNGAGKGLQVWRSFRKEGIANYFILTQRIPQKPLLVCETASRERNAGETKAGQTKAEWIGQMASALTTDMSKIRLLTWFNEKETFKITSSVEAKNAYRDFILKDNFFKSGKKQLCGFIKVTTLKK
jgi:beta-mannanase